MIIYSIILSQRLFKLFAPVAMESLIILENILPRSSGRRFSHSEAAKD